MVRRRRCRGRQRVGVTWRQKGPPMTEEPPQPSVVVIDDDRPIAEVVCEVLDEDGIPTSSCPYGEQAQACIRRKQPDLVILDIQMPGVDGIELFLRLRADPATAALPVIFFTANAHILRK